MSSEPGGRADKLGNEFERLWVVKHLIELLAGLALTVTIEPLGDDERGTEFWIQRPDTTREAHQCKRENGTRGKWSVSELESYRVITDARAQLARDPTHRFYFISGDKVPELSDFTERARRSETPELFIAAAATSKNHRAEFATLCDRLGIDPAIPSDLETLYGFLRKFYCRIADKEGLRDSVEELALRWIDGEPSDAVAVLKDLADKSIGKILNASNVESFLPHRLRPRDLSKDPRLSKAIGELRQRFDRSYRNLLINGSILKRRETTELFGLLTKPDGSRLILVHGSGGDGKSGVAFELSDYLAKAGIPFLPLRLDRDKPKDSPLQYGRSLDLPASPVTCLAAEAIGKPAILLLDQADAVRWTVAHSAHAWDTVERMVSEVLRHPELRAVVICRSFDIEDDRRIKAWMEREKAVLLKVGSLDDETVNRVVVAAGVDPRNINGTTRQVIRSPQGLYLWSRVVAETGTDPREFQTATGLMRQFWAMVRAERFPELQPGGYADALNALVDHMDRHGTLTAPKLCVSRWPLEVKALLSLNVLVEHSRRLLFAHQSYLDYLTAERVLQDVSRGTGHVVGWLRAHDQSLFRRGQLRLLLSLLRDDDPHVYISTLRSILLDEGIRFHLRHLMLQLLGQADPPNSDEVKLVAELAEDDSWLYHLASQVWADRLTWFDALHRSGALQTWLVSSEQKRVKLTLNLFEGSLKHRARIIASLISDPTTRSFRNDWLQQVIWRTAPNDLSPRFFRGFIRLVRSAPNSVRFINWKHFASAAPHRFIRILELCIHHSIRTPQTDRSDDAQRWLDSSSLLVGETLAAATEAVTRVPVETWDRLIPCLRKVLQNAKATKRWDRTKDFHLDYDRREQLRRTRFLLVKLLVAAGKSIVMIDAAAFVLRMNALSREKSRTLACLVARCLVSGPDSLADNAIAWIAQMPSRFMCGPGDRGAVYRPAYYLVRRYSDLCSHDLIDKLLDLVLGHRPKQERWSFLERHDVLLGKSSAFHKLHYDILGYNVLGSGQHILLSAIPQHRLPPSVLGWAGVLRRKFGNASDLIQRCPRYVSRSARDGPSIPLDRLHLLSDREWLRIVSGIGRRKRKESEAGGPEWAIEIEEGFLAGSLGEAARRQPDRFARLALRMDQNIHRTYILALLRAFGELQPPEKLNLADPGSWRPVSVEELEAVFAHFGGLEDDRELALSLCWAVRHRDGAVWSDAILAQLGRLATNHPDPLPGKFLGSRSRPSATTGKPESVPDVIGTSINCVRGCAADAIECIMYGQQDRFDTLLPYIIHLLVDPHPSVRAAALGLPIPMLNVDRNIAVARFVHGCSHPDDEILLSNEVARFLSHTILRFLPELTAILNRMLLSSIQEVVLKGAVWTALVWSYDGRLNDLVNNCVSGSNAQREGIAEACARSVPVGRGGDDAICLLAKSFNDESVRVREVASSVFRHEGLFSSPAAPALAVALVRSVAFDGNGNDLLWGLENHRGTLVPYAKTLREIIDRLIPPDGSRPLNAGSSDGGTLARLLLRLYEQAEDDTELRGQCLDAWDRLLREGLWFEVLKHLND